MLFSLFTKAVKISLITVLILGLIICAVFTVAFFDGYGVFENYSSWNTVEVPTQTDTTSTIKLPQDWSFTLENNLVYIKDSSGNIIAEEIFEGWHKASYSENVFVETSTEIIKNPKYIDFYTLYTAGEILCNNDGPCNIVEYHTEDGNVAYIMHIPVYISEKGIYVLTMRVYDEHFDLSRFNKLVKSVRYPTDFNQYED